MEPVEQLVGVPRVMVERDQRSGLDVAGEGEALLEAAVPPARSRRVFGHGVLGIVDQQVGTHRQVVARGPFLGPGEIDPQRRLVVGEVRDRDAIPLDPEPQCRSRVRDEIGHDDKGADLEPARDDIVQDHPRKLAQPDREQGRGQVTGQPLGQPHRRRGGPPEVDLDIGIEQRAEETEALDVIHVEMAEEDVEPPYAIARSSSTWAIPEPGIEQETRAIAIHHQRRRGVAAVADGGHTGPAHRAAGSEESQLHGIKVSAVTREAPRTW